ncbi:uncharacterized protein LOC132308161 [Cornus florida]|uniref:uncharacterized protein LOC132308161 n=1 Tax=Cornus florida TaxID=4283 RepID=UPI00289D350F|nr:uncharacterized protein LOC132308161 [Cornus florida]
MISITLSSLSSSSAAPLSFNPPPLSNFKSNFASHRRQKSNQRRARNGVCRAELSHDAPLAAAIGGCILNSLVFPITPAPDDDDGDAVIDSTDARFAVMGIISFIPYFNWLSWVFAWLDTGKRRYAVYAIVYLAPYLRSNLSLSPEESWLPIASIILCFIHIQLEASIRNGDLQGFQLFGEAAKHLSSVTRKKDSHLKNQQRISKEERMKEQMNLPSSDEQSRNEIQGWGTPPKPLKEREPLNEDEDEDEDEDAK